MPRLTSLRYDENRSAVVFSDDTFFKQLQNMLIKGAHAPGGTLAHDMVKGLLLGLPIDDQIPNPDACSQYLDGGDPPARNFR